MAEQLAAVALPEDVTPQWVAGDLAPKLDAASRAGAAQLKAVLAPDVCAQLLDRCQRVLHLEPTLLEVGFCAKFSRQCHPPPPLPPTLQAPGSTNHCTARCTAGGAAC